MLLGLRQWHVPDVSGVQGWAVGPTVVEGALVATVNCSGALLIIVPALLPFSELHPRPRYPPALPCSTLPPAVFHPRFTPAPPCPYVLRSALPLPPLSPP